MIGIAAAAAECLGMSWPAERRRLLARSNEDWHD